LLKVTTLLVVMVDMKGPSSYTVTSKNIKGPHSQLKLKAIVVL